MASSEMVNLATSLDATAGQFGARVIVNDRADVARLAAAAGVHVGQTDLPPADVRRLFPDALVGRSTHTPEQIEAALLEPIDYLAIGPIFSTATKSTGDAPLGLAGVREAASRARTRGLPLVAIGGITLERAADVIDAGADSVAVISDLVATGDPERRTRAYVEQLRARPDRFTV
jgi:thiamine-phosphate pyrophosphorylase